MLVYDDMGNMCNSHAAAIAHEGVQKAGEMFETLFSAGMTIVEARALLGYFKSELNTTIMMSILQHQMKSYPNEESSDE